MKVFPDTNVIVSAFTARGLCADLFRYLMAEHDIVTGEVNLVELRRVLTERFHATARQVGVVERLLRDQVIIPRPAEPSALRVRDPDDAWVLASAMDGKADVLVTGDKDLLSVAPQSAIPILSPRDAWERLRPAE